MECAITTPRSTNKQSYNLSHEDIDYTLTIEILDTIFINSKNEQCHKYFITFHSYFSQYINILSWNQSKIKN